jgi:hypothetical protein
LILTGPIGKQRLKEENCSAIDVATILADVVGATVPLTNQPHSENGGP